jgi:hypothetical protein
MEKKEVQIKVRDEDLKGVYSNLMQVSHTKEEFCLDFFNLFPPQGILTARVITSPGHLKRMIKAIEDNLKKYEEKFGVVEVSKETEKIVGFQAE